VEASIRCLQARAARNSKRSGARGAAVIDDYVVDDSPLRSVSRQAGPHGEIGSTEFVVLRDTSRMHIAVRAWFVRRSSGETQTSVKLMRLRKKPRTAVSDPVTPDDEITLEDGELNRLHELLHQFPALSAESKGDYVVVPLDTGDPGRVGADETARRVVAVLREPGVATRLAEIGLPSDAASALHVAARVTELRSAIAELREHLDGGRHLEKVYQAWCERHAWAFGNGWVVPDKVRHTALGDQVDLLVASAASGLRDVIELKRPNMAVITWDKTHKSWYWSSDTAKAIGQSHRYLDNLHRMAATGLDDHPEIVAYHPRATVVIGRSADWSQGEHRALHGLNARLHSITVMTYDQLLAQAEALVATLSADRAGGAGN
jgi:Domain of unknown function (DUF4263)